MRALILAGGLGTRLRNIYREGPKCMAPIDGHPFLEYQLCMLREQNVTDIILCVGYKHAQIKEWFADGKRFGVRLEYSIETGPLGTGGALKKAADMVDSFPVIVMNGDSMLEVGIAGLLKYHQKENAFATLALAFVNNASRYGSVQIDKDGHVITFREKSSNSAAGTDYVQLINGGVYVLGREVFNLIPDNRQVSLEKEVFQCLPTDKICAYTNTNYFIDIGVPADYIRAQQELPKRISL